MFGLFKRRTPPGLDSTSIGNLLVELGHVDRDTLREALTDQQKSGELLCALLVRAGSISEADARDVLDEQRLRRGEVGRREELKIRRARNKRKIEQLRSLSAIIE